jgi:hypothetical protein
LRGVGSASRAVMVKSGYFYPKVLANQERTTVFDIRMKNVSLFARASMKVECLQAQVCDGLVKNLAISPKRISETTGQIACLNEFG